MTSMLPRFASLYIFHVVVLLVVGWLLPNVQVGWHALWASVVLTAASLTIKPLLTKKFQAVAAGSARGRSSGAEKAVQYGIIFGTQLILWVLVVVLSGVKVEGILWGYLVPPLLLLAGWMVYDRITDKLDAGR